LRPVPGRAGQRATGLRFLHRGDGGPDPAYVLFFVEVQRRRVHLAETDWRTVRIPRMPTRPRPALRWRRQFASYVVPIPGGPVASGLRTRQSQATQPEWSEPDVQRRPLPFDHPRPGLLGRPARYDLLLTVATPWIDWTGRPTTAGQHKPPTDREPRGLAGAHGTDRLGQLPISSTFLCQFRSAASATCRQMTKRRSPWIWCAQLRTRKRLSSTFRGKIADMSAHSHRRMSVSQISGRLVLLTYQVTESLMRVDESDRNVRCRLSPVRR
jgi:hypothetical protein